jgi:putative membrane protein
MRLKGGIAGAASAWLAGAGVLAQIAYPLLSGAALRIATIVSVLLLAAASTGHAGAVSGRRGVLVVVGVAGGLGLLAETIGVHTGFPFGRYAYSADLGPRLAGVPIVVPLAWIMLSYPCLLLGRRLTCTLIGTALTGGVALTGWDLFLDPQMVAQGHWRWADPTPSLPGVPGVPLTNYAGWLLISIVIISALDRTLPSALPSSSPPVELTPAVILAWTWLGSTVGNLAFFHRPWVALDGGVVMGAVTLPYLLLVLRTSGRRERTAELTVEDCPT